MHELAAAALRRRAARGPALRGWLRRRHARRRGAAGAGVLRGVSRRASAPQAEAPRGLGQLVQAGHAHHVEAAADAHGVGAAPAAHEHVLIVVLLVESAAAVNTQDAFGDVHRAVAIPTHSLCTPVAGPARCQVRQDSISAATSAEVNGLRLRVRRLRRQRCLLGVSLDGNGALLRRNHHHAGLLPSVARGDEHLGAHIPRRGA
mmetsp:Transcript_99223/g.285469  ORF Transcript_99223/g.285469 Transcript_99223/m.285469 type:complete len:204 (+) Transcript_99223:449-1060(+)